jgi:hypothetical protein
MNGGADRNECDAGTICQRKIRALCIVTHSQHKVSTMREQNCKSRWPKVLAGIVSVPVRLLGLVMLVAFVPGLLRMIDLASLAGRQDIDPTLLAVRTLNQEKAVRPLLYLGYRRSVQESLIRVAPENTVMGELLNLVTLDAARTQTTNIDSQQLSDGTFQHTITFSDGTSRSETSATPHLKVPKNDQIAAANQLQQLFPHESHELQEWGESLFVSEWMLHRPLSSVPAAVVPEPMTGTADERAWLVWTALCGSNPEAPAELFRLRELFEASFPNEADRTAALNWADTLYDRVTADFTSYQSRIRRDEQSDADRGNERSEGEQRDSLFAACQRVLPPDSEWTRLWLLYRLVGLSESSRQAAYELLRSHLASDDDALIFAYGEALAAERRAAGEPLPPVKEIVPLLCLVERLTWTDLHGVKCREAIAELTGDDPGALVFLRFSILSAFPNDEIIFLAATEDLLETFPFGIDEGLEGAIERLTSLSVCILLAFAGISTLLHWIVIPVIFRKGTRSRQLWDNHSRGDSPLWHRLVSILVFGTFAALVVPVDLDTHTRVQVASFWELWAAGIFATAIGGLLISTCGQLLAVLLTAFRVDIEKTWLDEILGIVTGGALLWHFGNGWISIALFAFTDLAPSVVPALLKWSSTRRTHERVTSAFPTAKALRASATGAR